MHITTSCPCLQWYAPTECVVEVRYYNRLGGEGGGGEGERERAAAAAKKKKKKEEQRKASIKLCDPSSGAFVCVCFFRFFFFFKSSTMDVRAFVHCQARFDTVTWYPLSLMYCGSNTGNKTTPLFPLSPVPSPPPPLPAGSEKKEKKGGEDIQDRQTGTRTWFRSDTPHNSSSRRTLTSTKVFQVTTTPANQYLIKGRPRKRTVTAVPAGPGRTVASRNQRDSYWIGAAEIGRDGRGLLGGGGGWGGEEQGREREQRTGG